MITRPLACWIFGGLLLSSASAWAQNEAEPVAPAAPNDPASPAPTPDQPAVPEQPAEAAEADPSAEQTPASADDAAASEPDAPSEQVPAAPAEESAASEQAESPDGSAQTPAQVEEPVMQSSAEAESSVPVVSPSVDPTATEPQAEQEVQVLGSKASRVAGSVHFIREEQLERFEYDDAGMIFTQTPGVYIRQEDGMGLRPNIGMRGTNPNRSAKITLTEDGVLFGPAPYSAPAAYFFPSLTRMTSVRVLKGPSAIAYGPQTVGGAIDLVSRPIPVNTTGQLDLGVGEHGYFKGHAYFGTSTERFGFLVEGVRLQNTGFAQLPSGADTGSTRNEWMMKASYLVDPTAKVSNEFLFKFLYSDEVSNETYLGQSDADFRENPYHRYPASALDQMKLHRTGLTLTHLLQDPDRDLTLKTTLYRNDYQRTWKKLNRMGGASVASVVQHPDDPANQGYFGVLTGQVDSGSPADYLWIGPNNRSFISQGVQSLLTAGTQTGPIRHGVEAGLRFHNDSIKRLHTEDAYAMVDGELISAGQATLTSTSNQAISYALAAHISDALSYRALTVTPGIRTELIWSTLEDFQGGEKGNGFVAAFMPGAGIYYEILPGLGALGGIHRGFSPPPPASDNTVKPEYGVNYELGARYSKDRSRLEVIGFYNDYQNMTDVCTLSSGCVDDNLDRQFDAGRARTFGVEVFASHDVKLPLGLSLPASVAYTFSQGHFLTTFESQDPIYGSVTKGDEIPYLPQHQVNATLALEHRYGGVNAALNYVGRMRELAGSGEWVDAETTDEQFWLDLGVFGRPLPWLTIYANLRNATSEKNLVGRRPYGARVNAPRWLQAGVKAEF